MGIDNIKYTSPRTGTSASNPTVINGSTTVGGELNLLTADITAQQIAIETLLTLKKIEYHLSLMTDANLENL